MTDIKIGLTLEGIHKKIGHKVEPKKVEPKKEKKSKK